MMVRHSAAISSIEALFTPSAARRLRGASSRSAASTSWPLLRARFRHIGSPMVPTPMKPILSAMSVHNEEFGATCGARTMGEIAVGDLVALALLQDHSPAVGQLGVQFAIEHQQHMALLAPVVGQVTRRVLDDAHPDVVESARAPVGLAGLAGMLGALHAFPVGRAKRY